MSKYKSTYTAEEVLQLAEMFDLFASDQLGCIRFQTLKREKVECEIKAATYKDAADAIRRAIEANG